MQNSGVLTYLATLYTAVSRKVVRKSACDNPERYCGWFLDRWFSKKFQRMAREATDIFLWVLKESNKSRFDSYSVRIGTSVLIISILPFGIVACTVFATTFLEIAVYSTPIRAVLRTSSWGFPLLNNKQETWLLWIHRQQKENGTKRTS